MDYKVHKAPGKSQDGLHRNVLFRRTHSHLEAGRAASSDSDTGPPMPSVTLPRSVPDLFSQCSSLLISLPARKLMLTSHGAPCSGKTPLHVGGLSPGGSVGLPSRCSFSRRHSFYQCVRISALSSVFITLLHLCGPEIIFL